MEKYAKSGIVYGDTVLTGVKFIYKDGSEEYIECENPIILKTAEENNKNS